MKVVNTIKEVREQIALAKSQGKKIGFVPTMGFLHDGHLSLVKASQELSDFQVMSIFVNKMQFNVASDFDAYPKDLERDLKLAEEIGVDLVFIPDDNEMYRDRLTYVDIENLTDNLCGATRPGHFRGVFTVVAKLFNIVLPDVAVFGQKDIQQAISIQKMVFDLDFPLEIIVAPIVRESDGLAMSSRNKHLTKKYRSDALVLKNSLDTAKKFLQDGEKNCNVMISKMRDIINSGNPDKIDYISIVDYENLSLLDEISEKFVIAVSAFWGTTKLIDNMIVDFKEDKMDFSD